MSERPLRMVGDPVLRTECDRVRRFDGALSRLVDDLLDTVSVPGRAGVAAPQIGASVAVFAYNVEGQRGYVVNPVVVETEGEYDGPEGCLSLPGLTVDTPRAMRAVVTGSDRAGEPVTVEGTGELARCLQHETDHLRGILFIDRLSGERRAEALRWLRDRHAV